MPSEPVAITVYVVVPAVVLAGQIMAPVCFMAKSLVAVIPPIIPNAIIDPISHHNIVFVAVCFMLSPFEVCRTFLEDATRLVTVRRALNCKEYNAITRQFFSGVTDDYH